jgi:hypothetical protein
VYFTLNHIMVARAVLAGVVMAAYTPAIAETAFIVQVNPKSSGSAPMASQPIQAAGPQAPSQTSLVPTPEMFAPRTGNFAQTIQVGNAGQVLQLQSGGGNVSNVGVFGGKNNDVGVVQRGGDFSNLNLINTQGLSIAVIQPPGSAPINMLIARLPNGSLLVKR